MNTLLNLLAVAVLLALVLLPALVGLARERRIDRALRAAHPASRDEPPQPPAAVVLPARTGGRPYRGAWVRV
ncbi:hypothetical protein [uncultured Streptomyces sp.]|uniref:hypothetical protein n=1 Tax=uncultured Streptomyces sp. TaxID=174707 RepID=UPI0026140294|nr:hypothetical protein [uncultured Streptomyces sp.]